MLRVLGRVLFRESNFGLSCRLLSLQASKLSQDVALSSNTEEMSTSNDIQGHSPSAVDSLYSMRLRSKQSVLRQFHNALKPIYDPGNPSRSQINEIYNIVKLCTTSQVAEPPSVKVQLAEAMWKELQDRGFPAAVGFYNIMLKVYNSNQHDFKPSEFLQTITAQGVVPNHGTFCSLVESYCLHGNIAGATTLLDHMKNLDLPINENIYASLITGHSRCGNMERAEGIIRIMQERKHTPGNVAYTALVCGFAELGQMEHVERVLIEMRERKLFPSLMVYINLMNSLSQHGHTHLLNKALELCKNRKWLVADIRTLAATFVVRGEKESALVLTDALSEMDANTNHLSQLIVRHMAQDENMVTGEVLEVIPKLSELNYVEPFNLTQLYLALLTPLYYQPMTDDCAHDVLTIMADMVHRGATVQLHTIYPVLVHYSNGGRVKEFIDTLNKLQEMNVFLFNREITVFLGNVLSNADSQELKDCRPLPEVCMSVLVRLLAHANWSLATKWVQGIDGEKLNYEWIFRLIREKVTTYENIDTIMPICQALHSIAPPPMFSRGMQMLVLALNISKHYSQSISLVKQLEQLGICDCDVYCTLLLGLNPKQHKELFSETLAKLRKMPETNTSKKYQVLAKRIESNKREQPTTNMALQIANDQIQFEKALSDFHSASERGEVPTNLHDIILATFERNDIALAEEIISKALSLGHTPHERIWNRLIMHYAKQGNVDKTRAELERMMSYGVEPSEKTYKWVMHGHEVQGDVEEVRRLIDEARGRSLDVTRYFISSLISAFVKSNRLPEAISVIDEFKPLLPLTSTVVSLINEVVSQGLPHSHLTPLVETLQENKLADNTIDNVLLFTFIEHAQIEEAERILQKEGFEMDMRKIYTYFNKWISSGKMDVARFTVKLFVASGKTTTSSNNRSAFRTARSLLRNETMSNVGVFDVEDIAGVEDSSLERQVDMEELLKELVMENQATTTPSS